MLALLAGCSTSEDIAGASSDPSLFAATAMRIHPIFSQVKDWTGDGKLDGVEALLEFSDGFGDPNEIESILGAIEPTMQAMGYARD